MNLLSNSTFQFIITTSLTLLLSGISVWFSMRRSVQIPLTYETLVQQRVDPSNEEVRDLLAAIHISPDDSRVQDLNFVTFKLSNSGKESVTLTDDKPLNIRFKQGATILACEEVEKTQELEYTCWLEDEKILLVFPLLDSSDSIIFRILIIGRIYDFPDISLRVPGSKRIVRANNIRQSKEMFIIGIFFLFAAAYSFVSTGSMSSNPFSDGLWLVFFVGILMLVVSWLYRSLPPHHIMLPSDLLWATIKAIPLLIPLGILAILINHWLGRQTLIYVVLIVMCLFITFSFWLLPYAGITTLLKKKKIKYNTVLIGVLASKPSLAFLSLCVRVFFLYRW